MVRPQMQPPLRGATAPTFGKPPLGEARRSRARTVTIRAMYQSRLGSAPSTAGASVDDVSGVPDAALARHRALPSREAPWSPGLGPPAVWSCASSCQCALHGVSWPRLPLGHMLA